MAREKLFGWWVRKWRKIVRKNSVDVGGMVGEGYKREGKLEGREQFGREGDVSLI